MDYWAHNKVTPPQAHVGARFSEIIALISEGAKWFLILDLSNAFFTMPPHPYCWYKFAFTFQGTQDTFTWVPQGFHNAPVICHHYVVKKWTWLTDEDQGHVFSYVDGILLLGKDEQECLNCTERQGSR